MRSNIKITIIIPIYKVEHYIERCVRSLMEQTMAEGLEFLFINDCSPDRSMEILRRVISEYPARQSQIRILENEHNLGIFKTRRKGLYEAKGDYVGWCDADDWCEPEQFEKMYLATDNGEIDIIVADVYEDTDEESKHIKWHPSSTPHQCLRDSYLGWHFVGSLWQHIVRREYMAKAIETMAETSYGEDFFLLFHTYYSSSTIRHIPQPFYHYNHCNTISQTHRNHFTREEWERQRSNIDIIEQKMCKNGDYDSFRICLSAQKLSKKTAFRSSFPNLKSFYYTYREAYRDINEIYATDISNKAKTYIIHNFYPLFWWYNRKVFSKSYDNEMFK